MKITSLNIYAIRTEIPADWGYPVASFVNGGSVIIKINTDQGISGWGEPSPYGAPLDEMIKVLQKDIRPFIQGKNPSDVAKITSQDESRAKHIYGEAAWSSAIAGVSQALWDIIGKIENKPLFRLFNKQESIQNKIETYASGGMTFETPHSKEELIEEAMKAKDNGFHFWKFRPTSPKSNLSHFERSKNPPKFDAKELLQVSKMLRTKLGDDFGLMIDVGCRIPTTLEAIEFGKVLDELDFRFFEEPIKRNPEEYSNLTKKINTSVGIGECFFSAEQFIKWVDLKAVDILQPDANFAGITEILKISEIARQHDKEIILHNWTNAVSMAANAHLAVALPGCNLLEYSITFNPMRSDLIQNPFYVKDGFLTLSEKAGLGIEIDKNTLEKLCFYKDEEIS